MANPTIAIVGRLDVGKSTIFNHIAGERTSTVGDTPGVTCDRTCTAGEWSECRFSIIDTGRIDLGDKPFMDQVKHQAGITIDKADVIILVASDREGITDVNELVVKILYCSNKPVILIVDKIDNSKMRNDTYESYALELGDPFSVSDGHGLSIDDALDGAVKYFPNTSEEEDEDTIKSSLVGRPNADKSSLINAILGEDRVIISDIEGTARDAINTYFESEEGQKPLMTDTAGMCKRGKVYESTEKYSVVRAIRVIERLDIVLMVSNVEEGTYEQDKRVMGYAYKVGRGITIMVNKQDTVKKDTGTVRDFEAEIRDEFQYLSYAPIILVFALTKQRLDKLPELIETVSMNQNLRIPSTLLNDVVMDAVAINLIPTDKGKRLEIFYATQMAVRPPTFVISVSEEELVHFSYIRFLENQIRKASTFEGMPVKIIPRCRK